MGFFMTSDDTVSRGSSIHTSSDPALLNVVHGSGWPLGGDASFSCCSCVECVPLTVKSFWVYSTGSVRSLLCVLALSEQLVPMLIINPDQQQHGPSSCPGLHSVCPLTRSVQNYPELSRTIQTVRAGSGRPPHPLLSYSHSSCTSVTAPLFSTFSDWIN